jgi:hypothetical protein
MGNTNEMIANCSELITQYSTVVYVGMVFGKKFIPGLILWYWTNKCPYKTTQLGTKYR